MLQEPQGTGNISNLGQIIIFIEDMLQETQDTGNISKRLECPADI